MPRPRTRILLLHADETAAARLAADLQPLGVEVTVRTGVGAAIAALGERGFDLIVLAHPLPSTDLVAACAALAEHPAAPPLVVLDAAGDAAELARLLPPAMRPAHVLPGPADATKLGYALETLLEHGAPPPDEAPTSALSLPELLVELRDRNETGALELRAEGLCTTLHLQNGVPVFAEGGSLRETLGRLLLRQGHLSEADYVRVIERMTERLVDNEPLRMGEALTELGLMAPAEVYQALVDQVREKIVACFRWSRFEPCFRPMDALPEGVGTFDVPPLEALVLEGVRAHFGLGRVELLLRGHAAQRPRPPEDPETLARRFRLGPNEQRWLRGIDGRRSVAALRRGAELDELHVAQLLASLIVTGALRLEDEATAPADRSAARPPTLHAAQARVVVRAPAQTRPAAGPPRDEARARLDAEAAFRRGQALLSAGRFEPAWRAFGEALALQPREPEYAMAEAWAGYLAKRVEVSLARAKARACAMRVAQLDEDAARPHAILGSLAADERRFDVATREFEAAVLRDPEDRDAVQGLHALAAEGRRAGARRPEGGEPG